MKDSQTHTRPRILLLIPHLGGGGAERVTALLARKLSSQKYELHLGLVTAQDTAGAKFSAAVHVHALGGMRVRSSIVSLLRLVWRVRPRIILSGMAHLNFLVLFLRPFFPTVTRVLVRQNTTVSLVLREGRLPAYTKWLYHLLYQRADRVLCQSAAMAHDIITTLKLPASKVKVMANPVEIEVLRQRLRAGNVGHPPAGGIRLLAVGRLAHEKGYDLLLRAVAEIRSQHPQIELTIAGVGEEESALRTLCAELGLDDRVNFAGFVDEPFRNAGQTDLFILSSRFEGMPNALLEAAACGLPIVATPCSGGVVELLTGQQGVWLADKVSVSSLATSLQTALRTIQPGERFDHRFIEGFSIEHAIGAYEAMLDEELAR